MINKSFLISILFTLIFVPILSAQDISFTGKWKTIDDKTGKEKSIVVISLDENGNLTGQIEKVFRNPDEDQNPVCDKCEGDKKNAPLVGMQILWGFAQENKKNEHVWNSGKILDPKTGTIYGCNMTLDESGKKIQVRGFVGISLIGRTQTWVRIEEEIEEK
ncbi:MAG: DUF2147 domain-containing protein [Spirochaetia bacterium]|nr:DUF2147 domain-containing protein [Spirochaetia bacterium]